MVALYVKRINLGLMTVEEVPTKWRELVIIELSKQKNKIK